MGNKKTYVTLALATLLLCPVAWGQPAEKLMEVLKLQNANASEAAKTIEEFLGGQDFRIVADERTNALIIQASQETLKQAKSLLEFVDNNAASKEQDPPLLQVYFLKHIKSDFASSVLESVVAGMGDVRLAVDPRLNSIVLNAPQSVHDIVAELLELLDSPAEGQEQEITRTGSTSKFGTQTREQMELALALARQEDVKLEIIPGLDVVMLRGRKSAVDAFEDQLQAVMAVAKKTEMPAASSYAIHITWLLSNGSALEGSKAAPAHDSVSMQAIRKQAERFGIKDLREIGKLITATSVAPQSAAKFSVEGDVDLYQGREDQHVIKLLAEGTLGMVDEAAGILSVGLIVEASESRADVNIQLKAGKPIVIAAMPIESWAEQMHSLFVVEVVKLD